MSSHHYNGTDIVSVSQAKPEYSFSHARSCVYVAFGKFCQPGNADYRIINLSIAWLIMQSRLLHWYMYSYVYDCVLSTSY